MRPPRRRIGFVADRRSYPVEAGETRRRLFIRRGDAAKIIAQSQKPLLQHNINAEARPGICRKRAARCRNAPIARRRRNAHVRAFRYEAQRDDKPTSRSELVEAMRTADVLVPTVTDQDRRRSDRPAGEQLKLIANFGNGVDNIDVARRLESRHHRHQYAERSDRGHGRHDDGADSCRGAALVEGARPFRRPLDGLVADLDARAPDHRQAARHRRHGPDRPGRGAAGAKLRPANSLPQPAATSAGSIEEALEATYWESLDQMLARM